MAAVTPGMIEAGDAWGVFEQERAPLSHQEKVSTVASIALSTAAFATVLLADFSIIALSGTALLATSGALALAAVAIVHFGFGGWGNAPSLLRLYVGGMATFVASVGFVNIFWHENMHALAAKLVYQNPEPQISVTPFKGGFCSYRIRGMTSFGEWLGPNMSKAFVSAAGVVGEAAVGTAEVVVADRVEESKPWLAQALRIHAFLTAINTASYGITAYLPSGKNMTGHDFVSFQRLTGCPPIVSVAVLVALPLYFIGQAFLRLLDDEQALRNSFSPLPLHG